MKELDLANIEPQKEYKRIGAGGYIAKIGKVEDFPDKEYLKIEYDIAEGEFKDYYTELYVSKGFWGGTFFRSYKNTALSFFKSFVTSVENSNKGFVWTSNEQQLVGKLMGIVLGEELNPNKSDGSTRLYVDQVRSVDSIRKGDYKVPPVKGKADAKTAFKGTEVSL